MFQQFQRSLARLFRVKAEDPDLRRRTQIIMQIAFVLAVTVLLFTPIALTSPTPLRSTTLLSIAFVVFGGAFVVARSAYPETAAWLIIGICITVALVSAATITGRPPTTSAFLLLVTVVIAGFVLRPAQIWAVVGIDLVGLFIAISIYQRRTLLADVDLQAIYTAAGLLVMVGGIAFVGARTMQIVFGDVQRARVAAEHAQQSLAVVNAELESRVAERTRDLRTALVEVEERAAAQSQLLAENAQQREAIRELSVPVLPVGPDTLVIPLVGALDATRLQQIQDQALQTIECTQARTLLLDITGVPVVDTHVAQGLLAVVQAARLLGARVALVGIRPEVAQTIVGLGLTFGDIATYSTLQDGIAYALAKNTHRLN